MQIDTQFTIAIKYTAGYIHLRVRKIKQTAISEQFAVVAKNKTLIIQCDRPLLRAKGLKHKRLTWKIIDGQLSNAFLVSEIFRLVGDHIQSVENA